MPDPSSISMPPVPSLKLELCAVKMRINSAGVSHRATNRPSCSKFIVFVFNMELGKRKLSHRKHLQDEQIQAISAAQQHTDRWAGAERTDFS